MSPSVPWYLAQDALMKILDTKNAATFRPQRQTETRLEQTFGIANSECQGTALHSTRRDHEQCTHVHYADNVHRHTHTCIDTVYTNSYVAMTTLDQAAFALPPKDGPVLVSKAVRSLVDCFRTVSELESSGTRWTIVQAS